MDTAVRYRSFISFCILTVFVRHCVSKFSDDSVVNNNAVSFDTEEHLRRRKIVDLFISENTDTWPNEKWVETYNLNFKASENIDELDRSLKPTFSDVKGKVIESKSPVPEKSVKICKESVQVECIREKLYLNRWLKKLISKFHNPYNGYNFISFSLDPDSLKSLEELLSLNSFDIVKADEIIFNLISNATINDNHYYNWLAYVPSKEYVLTYTTIILSIVVFLYCLKNRPRYAAGLLIIFSCIWHSVNMVQKLTSQKHATLSRIPSAYCENTLTEESGVFAHIKQYFIDYVYAEECKKYYDALMVDPITEIDMLSVIVNFAVTVFLQVFQALAPVLNNFVKEVLYNTSFSQKIFVIIIFIFMYYIILLFFKYKIKLPFWLGSFEPTVIPKGSQAEDVKFPERDNLPLEKPIFENVDTPALNSSNLSKVTANQNTVLECNISDTKLISSILLHVKHDHMKHEACNAIEDVKPLNLLEQDAKRYSARDDVNEICSFSKKCDTCCSCQLHIKVDENEIFSHEKKSAVEE